MIESRPMADDRQTALAMFRFPYRELEAEEYAALCAHTIDPRSFTEYRRYRYSEPALDQWIERLHALLQSPVELDHLRRKNFRTSDLEYRLLSIGLCNEAEGTLKWCVLQGDKVRAGQKLLEFETEKAAFDLPCPRTGCVKWLCSGDTEIHLGQPLIVIEPSEIDHESANVQSGEAWWCPTNGTYNCEGWPHLCKLLEWPGSPINKMLPSGGSGVS
ncbi:MAG: biotin/lipoyl-containing protein [Pirellula sp.]